MGRKQGDVADLTRGTYRRQYSGFMAGKRINSVSLEAEAWFWRVHAAADDFGNVPADPVLLYGLTAGRRIGAVTMDRMNALVEELVAARLLQSYQAEGDTFFHVAGWLELQPAGKNGKRARRMPASPWDGGSDDPTFARGDARDRGEARKSRSDKDSAADSPEKGESKGIQNSPGDTGCHHHQDQNQDQDHNAPAAQAAAEIAAGAVAPDVDSSAREPQQQGHAPGGGEDRTVMVFACDGRPSSWPLKASYVASLESLFPALDILAECRAAWAYIDARPKCRKTAGGMKAFLTSWLTRSTNRPSMRAKPHQQSGSNSPPPPPRNGIVDRKLAMLEGSQ